MSTENQTQPAEKALTVTPKREVKTVSDDSPIAYLMDTARFEHCYRVAQMMGRASLIPKHLKGDSPEQTAANCFLVVNQALRWELDPFAIAPETYEVGGKLGFQGKLVAAVINARANLADKLTYTFNDKAGDALEVTVSGKFHGETEARTVSVSVKDARTQNQMWTKDPHQKLCYTGATKWARRHCPEIMLGVLTDDDLERAREEARFQKASAIPESPEFGPEPAKKKGKTVVVDVPPTPDPKPEAAAPEATDTAPQKTFEQIVDGEPAVKFIDGVIERLNAASVTPEQALKFYNANRATDKAEAKSLDDVPEASWDRLLKPAMLTRIKATTTV